MAGGNKEQIQAMGKSSLAQMTSAAEKTFSAVTEKTNEFIEQTAATLGMEDWLAVSRAAAANMTLEDAEKLVGDAIEVISDLREQAEMATLIGGLMDNPQGVLEDPLQALAVASVASKMFVNPDSHSLLIKASEVIERTTALVDFTCAAVDLHAANESVCDGIQTLVQESNGSLATFAGRLANTTMENISSVNETVSNLVTFSMFKPQEAKGEPEGPEQAPTPNKP